MIIRMLASRFGPNAALYSSGVQYDLADDLALRFVGSGVAEVVSGRPFNDAQPTLTGAEAAAVRGLGLGAVLSTASAAAAANTAAAQAILNTVGSLAITVPGTYLFDTTAGPILIPNNGSVYKGPGVVLKVAPGSPGALFTNHTARLAAVATVPGANITYAAAPDGDNYVAVISGLSPAQLANFPVGSWVSAVILGHGAGGSAGTARASRGYRGVRRVVANDGVSTLRYEIDLLYPGSAPSSNQAFLYRVTENPRIWGPGEIDGSGADASASFNDGDPRGVPVWWHHAVNPVVEGGTWKRGRTWTVGGNYCRDLKVLDAIPRLRNDGVSLPSTDFVHICGWQLNPLISGNSGDSGDNFVGMTQDCTGGTAYDFPYQFPGDMDNVRISRTAGHSVSDHGAFAIIGIYGPAAYQYGAIIIDGVRGAGSAAVQLANYAPTNQNNLCIASLRVSDAVVLGLGSGVELLAGTHTIGEMVLTDVYNVREDVNVLKIFPAAVGSIRSLRLQRLGVTPYDSVTYTRTVPVAVFGGINIGMLSIDGCENISLAANLRAFLSDGTGNIGKVGISSCSAAGTGTANVWGDTGGGTAAAPVYWNSTYNGTAL